MNFWPEDLLEERLTAPVTILKEAASDLVHKTKGLIEGEIVTQGSGSTFTHTFFLVVPTLGSYRLHLLNVSHDVSFYPVGIVVVPLGGTSFSANNEQQFKEQLSRIFAEPRIVNILKSLLAQVVEA